MIYEPTSTQDFYRDLARSFALVPLLRPFLLGLALLFLLLSRLLGFLFLLLCHPAAGSLGDVYRPDQLV